MARDKTKTKRQKMTRGPTNACINFHCNEALETKATVQIALNDSADYAGGRLCFFAMKENAQEDELTILERPAGSVCVHRTHVLHAVTSLTSGTRQSLFVVDATNGLGENGVVGVTASDVQSFLKARRERAEVSLTDIGMPNVLVGPPSSADISGCADDVRLPVDAGDGMTE